MERSVLLPRAAEDGRGLLMAAEHGWGRPVPHCPEWDTAGLVRHTGGILVWMAAVVASGERVSRRGLDDAPDGFEDLSSWYVAALERTVEVLGAADPESATWTFSSTGDQRAGWWRRRLAVELAIHRYDAEHAWAADGGPPTGELDGEVAEAGVEEFLVEFLPGLLAQEGIEGFGGTLRLQAVDGPAEWWVDLDDEGRACTGYAEAGTTIRGSRSDLLLWLTNRGRPKAPESFGDDAVLDGWIQLRR